MTEPTSARQGGAGTEVVDDTVTDNTATDNTATDNTATENTATENAAAENTASENAAAENTASQAAGNAENTASAAVGDDEAREQPPGPVIRDKRRLDPQTGQVRAAYASTEPAAGDSTQQTVDQVDIGASGEGAPADAAAREQRDGHLVELEAARAVADERLLDLQRLQAEYVNYRRRVDRDRDVARDSAVASVLEALLPVLDDVHLARQHGDLEDGPFAAIADKLEATLARFGLVRYGEPGEPFDPKIHEALLHTQAELAEGTTETTVVQILQPGYRAGERVLRAARVAVADPQ